MVFFPCNRLFGQITFRLFFRINQDIVDANFIFRIRIDPFKPDSSKLALTNTEWKNLLSPEVYAIAREKGTERPFTSPFETSKKLGTYYCAACGNPLFKSNAKFDSGCGWPSFFEPITKSSILYLPDNTLGMKRTEVECGRCKAHLGHVFEDGPPPTGLRYCINGVVLDFEEKK